MNYIGFDNKGNKLNIGDICKFKLDKTEFEGMIMYDEEQYAYIFKFNENFNGLISVVMNVVIKNSIEKNNKCIFNN